MTRFCPVALIWFTTLVFIIFKYAKVSARTLAVRPRKRSGWLKWTGYYRGGGLEEVTKIEGKGRNNGEESVGNETFERSEDFLLHNGPSDQAFGDTSNVTLHRPREKWRDMLPNKLQSKSSKTLQKLRLGQTDIYLIGTAHVSNDSATDTRVLLEHIQPDCVFVELCDMRLGLLEGSEEGAHEIRKNMTFFQKVREAREAEGTSRLFALSSVLLSSWQDDFAGELGVELGGEFRQAHKYWKNKTSSHLILGDRPLTLTLYRAWESLAWWPKLKVVLGLLWSSFKKPNKDEVKQWLESIMKEESDVLTKSMAELRQSFPTLYATIIEERDAWLAAKLFQTCRALQGQESTVVAIIGAGHMNGVCRWLTKPPSRTSPEQVLSGLVATKRWENDETIQKEAIPVWIHHVSELQRGQ